MRKPLDMIEAALREKGFLLEQEEWEKKSSITYNEKERSDIRNRCLTS